MAGPFGLDDADFWERPYRTKDAVQQRLAKEGATGVFIDAPARVPLDGRTSLPIVGCFVVSLRDARTLSFDKNAVVASVHLDDGRTHVDLVAPPRVRDPSAPRPAPDDEDPGEGRVYSMFKLDAHARLPDLPWEKGKIVTTVLLRGQRSERVTSELVAPPPRGFVDPVVAEAVAAAPPRERAPHPVQPKPAGELPTYRRDARSPAPPAQAGLSLIALRKVPASGQLIVRGTFALPLLEHQVVQDPQVNDPDARAVVPVDLVLLGEETPGPFVIHLGVPIHELPAEGKPARGYFGLDLLKQPAMSHRKKQRYWLWAFSGEALWGPHELTIT